MRDTRPARVAVIRQVSHAQSAVATTLNGAEASCRSPIVAAAIGCLTIDLASVGAPRTAAQARLAALPLETPAPADNPTTPERVALGRLLFWDPILSGQRDVACATCHHPDFGYSDGLDLSIGTNGAGLGAARAFASGQPARLVKRNSQTVLNVAFNGLTPARILRRRLRRCSGI